jgi:hypothetical protein
MTRRLCGGVPEDVPAMNMPLYTPCSTGKNKGVMHLRALLIVKLLFNHLFCRRG